MPIARQPYLQAVVLGRLEPGQVHGSHLAKGQVEHLLSCDDHRVALGFAAVDYQKRELIVWRFGEGKLKKQAEYILRSFFQRRGPVFFAVAERNHTRRPIECSRLAGGVRLPALQGEEVGSQDTVLDLAQAGLQNPVRLE